MTASPKPARKKRSPAAREVIKLRDECTELFWGAVMIGIYYMVAPITDRWLLGIDDGDFGKLLSKIARAILIYRLILPKLPRMWSALMRTLAAMGVQLFKSFGDVAVQFHETRGRIEAARREREQNGD